MKKALKTAPAKHDPAPYKGKTHYYIAGLLVAAIIFGVSALLAAKGTYTGWEVSWFRAINDWPNSWRPFFLVCTLAPEALMIGAAAVVIAFVCRMYRLAWRLSVGIIGASAVAYLGKHFIDRARPFDMLANVHVRMHESGAGFPSGHTTVMTVIMLMLLPYIPKKWRWIVPVPIVLIALSRIYLGVHVPLDVIGGFAIGLGTVSFLRILPQSIKVALRLD